MYAFVARISFEVRILPRGVWMVQRGVEVVLLFEEEEMLWTGVPVWRFRPRGRASSRIPQTKR